MSLKRLEVAVLRLLSRNPSLGRHPGGGARGVDDALRLLTTWFPGFLDGIQGKTIVDFGCGHGFQTLALARAGAKLVIGVDINSAHLAQAAALAKQAGIDNALFREGIEPSSHGTFDIVISQDSMEHFSQPLEVMRLLSALPHPEGKIYVMFGPPWFSPYGAHTSFFCKVPWIHLIFSEEAVLAVRKGFTTDNPTRYEEIRGGLNRMSLGKFEAILAQTRLRPVYDSYCYALNLRFLHNIPVLRELLLYQVNVVLAPR